MKNDVLQSVRSCLASELDTRLKELGFGRRANSLIYQRRFSGASQRIEVSVELRPRDNLEAAAAIYPWLEVCIPIVDELVSVMTDGDESLTPGLRGKSSGASVTTLREPIEFTSAKAASARWFLYQPDSVRGTVIEAGEFLEHWTLPFLNAYATPKDMCEAYDRDDERVINTHATKLRVVAAMVLCGRTADATDVMNRWFGYPGPRARYRRVFEYLAAKD